MSLSLVAAATLLAAADTLVVGTLADPPSLDPHATTDAVSAAVASSVCDTLVRFRPGGERPEPGLATTWATRDGRTWTLTLRGGVRFHDGVPLDADAVVANLENLRRRRAFPGRASRVGPHAVTIVLERPNASLLATLSQPFYSMQSPAELGAERRAPGLVGTGPFKLASAQPGRLVLEANTGYWGAAPRLRRLVFQRFADEDAMSAALVSGQADVSLAFGHRPPARLRESPEIVVGSHTGLAVALLCLNNERAPFTDRRVRQAIARALDRPRMVADLGGDAVPARNPLPPSLFGYAGRTQELSLDRPAARRLLARAGFPHGFDVTLLSASVPRPYMPDPAALAADVRADLAEVGVRATTRTVASWPEYLAAGSRGEYEMMLLGWQADTADPNDFLSVLLGSEFVGTTNRSRYRSPEMDALLKRGRMTTIPAERLAIYHEAQELFQKDLPWVPLYHAAVFTARRRDVHGVELDATGSPRFERAWKED